MTWAQSDIDTLKAAIASNSVLSSLTVDGQTFQFRSVDDMLKLLATMTQEVNATAGTSASTRYASVSKGF